MLGFWYGFLPHSHGYDLQKAGPTAEPFPQSIRVYRDPRSLWLGSIFTTFVSTVQVQVSNLVLSSMQTLCYSHPLFPSSTEILL